MLERVVDFCRFLKSVLASTGSQRADFSGEQMANASEWKATNDSARTFAGITVLHGGPEAGFVPEHAHSEAEVSVHFRSNGAKGLVPTHAHLYAPDRPHSGGWKNGRQVIVLKLTRQLLDEAADELLRNGRFEISTLRHVRDSMFEEIATAVAREFCPPDRFGRFYVESMGKVLAGYVLRNYAESAPRPGSTRALSDVQLMKVRRFIEEQIESGLSVQELAATIGLGAQEFSQKLSLAVGLSPWRYVNSVRLSIAMRLLRDSRLSIANIACRLGFVDQSHFTNVFRRACGVTPRVFRTNLGSGLCRFRG